MKQRKAAALILIGMALAGMTGCTKSPEVRRQQALERGKKYLEAKDLARAVIEFRNAVQAAPKDAESSYQLGVALLASGDVRNGYAALRRATELDPKHADAQIKVSELLSATNKPELLKDAAQRLETLLAAKPGDSEALSTLAYTEMRLGEMKEAEEHLERALESGPTNLKAAVGLARARIGQGKVDEAEQILRRVADQKPPASMPFVTMGQFYLSNKKDAEARRQFQRALEIDSNNVLALLYLGALHIRAGETAEADAVYKRISALPEKPYRAIHAIYLFQTGKREEALKELEQLVTADGSDRPTRRRLVAAYLSLGRTADAERVLAAAMEKNGRDTDALLQRSAIFLARGNFVDAQNDLTQVLNFEPDSAEAHYMLSRVHAARGNVSSQRQELGEAVRLNPEYLSARLEYARSLVRSNIAKSALEVLDQTPEWQKRNPAVIAERNWALAALGKKEDMKKGIDEALKMVRSPDLMLQDAVLKLDAGNSAAAMSVLEQMLKLFPNDLRAVELIGQSYAAKGQLHAAVRRVREHAAANPKNARAQYQLGTWLQRARAVSDARAAFRAATAADPSFWTADVALAGLEIAENNAAAAKTLLLPLAEHPHAGIQARVLLAMAEEKEHNGAAAIGHYRKVVEAQPDNVLALNNLAYVLSENANSPDEALKFAERAKELAPDNPTIDDTLGWILYRKGLHSRALQYLQSSVSKQPNAVRHAHLAMAYAASGDTKRGFDQLEAAIRMGGSTMPEVQAAQRALAAAR